MTSSSALSSCSTSVPFPSLSMCTTSVSVSSLIDGALIVTLICFSGSISLPFTSLNVISTATICFTVPSTVSFTVSMTSSCSTGVSIIVVPSGKVPSSAAALTVTKFSIVSSKVTAGYDKTGDGSVSSSVSDMEESPVSSIVSVSSSFNASCSLLSEDSLSVRPGSCSAESLFMDTAGIISRYVVTNTTSAIIIGIYLFSILLIFFIR